MSINLIKLIRTAVYRDWLKSEDLFRTCSFATDLVTSLEFLSDQYFSAVPFLANNGTVLCSLIFTRIAALLQAVLQDNTEPFWNGLVEMRNRTIYMSLSDAQLEHMYILASNHEFLVLFY